MTKEDAHRVSDIFNNAIHNREPLLGIVNVNIHKNGSEVILETNGIPIFDVHGELVGYRGVNRNTTFRKKSEELIKKQRDLALNLASSHEFDENDQAMS